MLCHCSRRPKGRGNVTRVRRLELGEQHSLVDAGQEFSASLSNAETAPRPTSGYSLHVSLTGVKKGFECR
jgi:hypothetical protein